MGAWLYPLLILLGLAPPPAGTRTPSGGGDLDRVALAVQGVESRYGADQAMWRPNPSGPQGPMQVSAAAAADVGDGDRFDPAENRRLGRAYLALLYRRYRNWPDAVAAYYWGPGNIDRWVAAGRDPETVSVPLRAYVERVMHGAVLAAGPAPPASLAPPVAAAVTPPEPAPADIRRPELRRKYLADREAIDILRLYLDATPAAAPGTDAVAVASLIRRIAVRPGYQEFAPRRPAHAAAPPSAAALRQIASALLDKLRADCAAIALIDRRRESHTR